MIKDQEFYNKESQRYSSRRYPEVSENYVQYFFKRRLVETLRLLPLGAPGDHKLDVCEVGCADGVVVRAVLDSGKVKSAVGIDNAPAMIAAAKEMTKDSRATFYVRGEEPRQNFDVIIEVGVANYADFGEELMYAKERLKQNGIYVLSIAGKGSFNSLLKRGEGYRNFWSYREYESKIREIFTMQAIVPVGVAIPYIWRVPSLGRTLQPIFELVFRLFPGVYHEKVYLLRSKI